MNNSKQFYLLQGYDNADARQRHHRKEAVTKNRYCDANRDARNSNKIQQGVNGQAAQHSNAVNVAKM